MKTRALKSIRFEETERFASSLADKIVLGGVLPFMGYIGISGPKGYGFSAALVINGVSILVDFGHFGHN